MHWYFIIFTVAQLNRNEFSITHLKVLHPSLQKGTKTYVSNYWEGNGMPYALISCRPKTYYAKYENLFLHFGVGLHSSPQFNEVKNILNGSSITSFLNISMHLELTVSLRSESMLLELMAFFILSLPGLCLRLTTSRCVFGSGTSRWT